MGTLKAGGENRVDFGGKVFLLGSRVFHEVFIRLRQVNQWCTKKAHKKLWIAPAYFVLIGVLKNTVR